MNMHHFAWASHRGQELLIPEKGMPANSVDIKVQQICNIVKVLRDLHFKIKPFQLLVLKFSHQQLLQ